jgi:hypothetical protein
MEATSIALSAFYALRRRAEPINAHHTLRMVVTVMIPSEITQYRQYTSSTYFSMRVR